MIARTRAWNGRLTRPASFISSKYRGGSSVVFYWYVVRLYDSDLSYHAKWIELTKRHLMNESYFWCTLLMESLSSSSVEFKSSVSLESNQFRILAYSLRTALTLQLSPRQTLT